MNKTICFLGVEKSFGYRQIGGTDSYYRRLAHNWAQSGRRVEFILYNSESNHQENPVENLYIYHFVNLKEAFIHLNQSNKNIFVNAIKAIDRLKFIYFRYKFRKSHNFIMIYTLFPNSFIKKLKHFLEAKIYGYNGGYLCMSKRLLGYVAHFGNVHYAIPPVDDFFFKKTDSVSINSSKIHVSYIGRLENGKGAIDASKILKALSLTNNFKLSTIAYAFKNDPEADEIETFFKDIDKLDYSRREHSGWALENDHDLADFLHTVDILLLPYKQVSSSIDTPLLLLEGMAAGCIILTRSIENLPAILGESAFLIPQDDFVKRSISTVSQTTLSKINEEKVKSRARIDELQCSTKEVASHIQSIFNL